MELRDAKVTTHTLNRDLLFEAVTDPEGPEAR